MNEEIMADTWPEFEIKARGFVAEGYSDVTPMDVPKQLLLGYVFSKPGNDGNGKWIKIKIFNVKKTRPDSLPASLFATQQGQIDLSNMLGNYRPPISKSDEA